jgi:hypothetical protein
LDIGVPARVREFDRVAKRKFLQIIWQLTTLLPSSVPIQYLWMLRPYNLGGIFGSQLIRA